jgi:hypothetical protein
VKVVLWLALSATGTVIPLTVKAAALEFAWERLIVEGLLLVSVMVCVLCLPTVTVPKLSLAGLASNWPLEIPVPVSEKLALPLLASLTIEAVALISPAEMGVNVIVIAALCPAAIVVGIAGVFNEKAWLEIETLLTVIEAEPLFDKVIESVLLVPVVTVPNASTLPPMLSVLVGACTAAVLLELNPMHPTIVPRQSRRTVSLPARLRFTSASA